jgi:hypothetical protein
VHLNACSLQDGVKCGQAGLDPRLPSRGDDAHVDAHAASFRHNVGARSTFDDPHADGRARKRSGQFLDPRNLVRHFDDGVDSGLRLVPGVGGPSDGLDDEDARPFAAGLERPVGHRRLQAKDEARSARLILQQAA